MFQVFEGANGLAHFSEAARGPPATTEERAIARFALNRDGTLGYELRATGPIQDAVQAHIHLGGRGQNGPVVTFLLESAAAEGFLAGDVIARGTLEAAARGCKEPQSRLKVLWDLIVGAARDFLQGGLFPQSQVGQEIRT